MATDSTHLLPSDGSVETESDMAGSAPDFASVQLAAASGDAPISVQLPQHAPIIVIPVKPGQTIELPTDSTDGLLAKLGADGNLAIVIDGRTIILQGYAQANADPDHPVKIVTNDGDVVDVNEVIVSTNPDVALDIQTAAGPAAAGAQGGTNGPDAAGSGIFVPFAAGPILGGFDAAGVLGATELQYKTITDERILFPIEEEEQAPTPTPHISIAAEDGIDPVCIHEDSQGEAILVEASTDAGSHLTSVVISGFPIGGAGFGFNFSGLDTDGAGTDVTVDTSKLAAFGEVTVTFAGTQTSYNGAFIVTPPADSDVDLGTLTAKVEAANNSDPSVKADSSDDALVIVDAVADGDDVGDDGDADKLSLTIGITDGGDANGSFQNGETGTLALKATFDDFKDGSETHTLTVTAPDGFTFGGPSLIPLGVSVVSNDGTTIVFSVDSHDGDGQDGLGAILIQVPVTYNGGESDGATGDFVATVSTVETPTDEECDLTNNEDTATQATSAIIATTPTPGVQIGAEAGLDHVCVFEDTTSDPIALTASTNAGSHLTTVVISGFPVGGAGFSFDFTGLDLATTTITDKIAIDGTVIVTFDNATTTGFGGTFTVTPPADSDVDLGTLTATVNAANDVDTNVTASANDQAAVIVDAVADGDDVGDDGDAFALGVTVTVQDSGGDANTSFQAGELGTATVTASFDDFHDGSEHHQLTITAAPGFTFLAPPPPPPGVTVVFFSPTLVVFDVDSNDLVPPLGVSNLALGIPVLYSGGLPDGTTAPFIATVSAVEVPTDEECDLTNNADTASAVASTVVAGTPRPTVDIAGQVDHVCVFEDTTSDPIPLTASTTAGSHLTSIVITGFPVGGGGFTFDFSALDTDGAGTDVTVDTSQLATLGQVTVTFTGTQTSFNGSFTVTPAADSDVDLGTLTATVNAANNLDPSVTATTNDQAEIVVDAVADGDDGDADKLGVTITSVVDGVDGNTTFQPNETGTVNVSATFDDFKDGSEAHRLTVDAAAGFAFNPGDVGVLPAGVVLNAGLSSATHLVFDIDSSDPGGVGSLALSIPVTYTGGQADGASGNFTATVTAVETPTDEECDLGNNSASASDTEATTIAKAPTTDVRVGAEGNTDFVCVPEDSAGVAVPVAASASAGSHLTSIVITGFPIGGGAFSFNFAGLDTDGGGVGVTVDTSQLNALGQVTINFTGLQTLYNGSFTVIPAADSDVDLGTLTATVTAANDVDPTVTATDSDQAYVRVDAIADGDDGDADKLGVTITSIVDGLDANSTFQANETGRVNISATFDDFKDGSEAHRLTVDAAVGFTFNLADVGTLPAGVVLNIALSTTTHLVFDVDSHDGDGQNGVGSLSLSIPVACDAVVSDGPTGNFTAVVTAQEIPTDLECNFENNFALVSDTEATMIAKVPTTDVQLGVEGNTDFICVPEDSPGVPVPVTASANFGSHLASIVITGFPIGATGFTFNFTGLDTDGGGAGVTVDTSQLATLGQVTVNFTGIHTGYFGTFTVIPAADSDVDLGTLTATVTAANDIDPSVTATDSDQAYVRVDAVADGDDGDADKLGVTITSIVDGVDANSTFQNGEAGKVNISATFDDFKDGSEAHRLTVDAAAGFTFNLGDVGTLPAGVVLNLGLSTITHLVFDVDSSDPGGVGGLALSIPVTYTGGQPDGASGNFTATVTAVETPTDLECTTDNNSALASDTEKTAIATAPTTDVRVGAEGNTDFVCVPEDSAGVAVPVVASASVGSHLTSIVITGFPIGATGFTFNFTGLDTDGGGAGVTVDTSQLNALGQVTVNFTGTQTAYNGSFTVIPAADSDVDLGTVTAVVHAANNSDPSVTATDSDQAYVRVDAVADGDDGDADKLGVSITSVVDGVDGNSTFQVGETGKVNISATFDDYKDGSETHQLTVDAPTGFTFNLLDVGTLPAGVTLDGSSTTTHLVFNVDSKDSPVPLGVGSLSLSIPVTYTGGQPDGATGNFTATVTAQENPTDLECDTQNNFASANDTEATTIAKTPTTDVRVGAEGNTDFVCVPEDSAGVAVPVVASASAGSHLTSIVITGFPIGATGFTFNFTGLDTDGGGAGVTVDTSQLATLGQVTINFTGTQTAYNGSFTVIPAADSDVDLGTVTATVTAANNIDPTVTATDSDQAYVRVDAVADGDDGDADKLGVTITSIVDGVDGNTTFQVGETGKVNISATFDDFKDGSETHTLTVDAPTGFAFNLADVGTLPTGVTLDGSSTTTHLVFNVDSKDSPVPLGVGSLSLSIPVTYNGGVPDGSSGNFTATVTAQENPTDLECDVTNNKATQSDTEATAINNDLASGTLKADGCVFEDNEPNQYTGDTTKVYEALNVSFTPTDNETITGASITIPTNWQVQVWDTGSNSVVTTLGAGSDVNISAYIANILTGTYQLRPIPPTNTDVDGSFNIKLNIQDPDSGLTDTLTNNFTVYVDAVADKPTGVDIIVKDSAADANSSFALGETGTLQVKAAFGDATDNSEVHTITVTLQSGFTAPTLSANGTLDGFAYTYNQATGVIVFTVPNGTASFDETFNVKAPTSGTLPSNLVFTVDAKAVETNLSGGGCDTGNVDLAANNKATTSDQTGIPASRLLTGEFITNTNVQQQQLLITFVNAANFLEADAQIYSLGLQGQQGNIAQDAGFDINGSQQYLLSVEAAVNPKVILTDMTLESTVLHDSGNIQFELNDNTAGPDRTAYTWIMTPDNAVPNQGETASIDGDAAANNTTDATPTVFNYLYGADGIDTLNGSSGADILNGGAGKDTLNGNGGNDILVYDPLDTINGGTGSDILRIDQGAIAITKHQDGSLAGNPTAAETTVDLSGKAISNIEAILITTEAQPDDNFGTTVRLHAADVLNFSGDAADHSLYVIGQKGDQVQLFTSDAANWVDGDANAANGVTATGSVTIGSQVFNIYTASNGAHLYVDQDVTVTTAA